MWVPFNIADGVLAIAGNDNNLRACLYLVRSYLLKVLVGLRSVESTLAHFCGYGVAKKTETLPITGFSIDKTSILRRVIS